MFAHISNGVVADFFAVPAGHKISDYWPPDMTWIDVSEVTPEPSAGWAYDGSVFHAPVAPAIDWRALARAALDTSDTTILRCYENAVVVPSAWATYRAALRGIIAGGSVTALPVRPAYPAGT